MFIDLLLKKNGKILFFVFLILFTITTCVGIGFVVNNLNTNVLQFEKDGYALFLDEVKSAKAEAYSFNSGTEYRYKKSSETISFKSEDKNVKVYLIGQKAIPAIRNAQKQVGFEIKRSYVDILDDMNSSSAYVVASDLADAYVKKEIDEIHLVTTRYKNMMTCATQDWQLLPAIIDDKIADFRDEELDKELNVSHDVHKIEPLSEYIPSLNDVLAKVVPMYITNIIYQSFLEAQASELSSRMSAMSAATNNASDMISSLTIEYNKARQAKITQEITEVISGAGALK